MKAIHKYKNGGKYRGKIVSRDEQRRRILQSMTSQGLLLKPNLINSSNTQIVDDVEKVQAKISDGDTIQL